MIEFRESVLKNGIRLVMSRKPEIPNVIINSCFHVGSKDEEPAKTGISHLLEHLMFSGSANIPDGKFDEILHANGGESNAFTTQDFTSYYLSIPSSKLELGMWLDSDRYAEFPVNDEGLEIQRKVVMEEKLQVQDNTPFGSLEYESAIRLFSNSGYRWQIIGDEKHIEGFTLKDVREYYDKFYNPNNMVLAITGDIDYEETVKSAERYYGEIQSSGKKIVRDYNEAELKTSTDEDIEDNISLPARFVFYRVPRIGTNEFYTSRLISVGLSSGESSRVYQELVRKSNISTESFIMSQGMEFESIFSFNCFINEGKTIKEASKVMDNIFAELAENGLSENEIEKSINKVITSYYLKIQQSLKLASSLSFYKLFFNDCNMINKEVEIFKQITNQEVKNFAQKYLFDNKSVALNYIPKRKVKM
jgi:predicted Zn-dependent peptidase